MKTKTTFYRDVRRLLTLTVFLMLPLLPLIGENTERPRVPTNNNDNDVADIYLNFENASLASVVNYLAEQKKINFIPHKNLAAKKVSLTTRTPLTLTRAWDVLLTLLEMNGFSIINVGNVYRIVLSKGAKNEPLPLYSSQQGTAPKDLPDSDLIVRYIYILKHISTQTASKILIELLGKDKVQVNKDLATCIITDKCFNIKAAMKVIEALDTGGLRESIKIYRLKHTNAEDIAKLFTSQILGNERQQKKPIRFIGPAKKKELTYFASATKIIPEPRYNALILLGLEQDINKIIEFTKKYLDIPMEGAQSRIHIKELKYVEAPVIEKILKKIIKPPTGGKKGPLVGEFKFFEDVKIQSEKPEAGGEEGGKISKGSGNRLIIACSRDDWRRLDKIIEKLDKPQPQVALEIMIVDIDEANLRRLGSEIREKTGKSLAKGLTWFTTNLQTIDLQDTIDKETEEIVKAEFNQNLIKVAGNDGAGATSVTIGDALKNDVWMVIKSVITESHTNIVSQPFGVVSNNEKYIFSTKEERNLPDKIETKDGNSNVTFARVPAETKVEITPRINVGGLVDMQINITLEEFLAGTDTNTPPKSTRSLDTRVSMGTGEVLVLGGLTRDKVTVNLHKTPILGDIPILGNLFRSKSKTISRTHLYLFIRPSIIKPHFDGGPDEYTRLKLDYAKYQIMNVEELRHTKDPIQRWYFKPEGQPIKQTLKDLKNGVFRPIDDYSERKKQPKSVRIERDPYYRASASIKAEIHKKEREEATKRKRFQIEKKRRSQQAARGKPRRRSLAFGGVKNNKTKSKRRSLGKLTLGKERVTQSKRRSLGKFTFGKTNKTKKVANYEVAMHHEDVPLRSSLLFKKDKYLLPSLRRRSRRG